MKKEIEYYEPYQAMLYIKPYLDQSTEEINKRDLMKLCLNRIKAHQKVYQLFGQVDYAELLKDEKRLSELNSKAIKIYNEYQCYKGNDQFYIEDNAAHFFLELAYSETDERINEFIKYQKILFQIRCKEYLELDDNNYRLLKIYQMLLDEKDQIIKLTQQDWEEELPKQYRLPNQTNNIGRQIVQGTGRSQLRMFNNTQNYLRFYKIRFYHVLNTVSQLHTYVKNGYAYIHAEDLKFCLLEVFLGKMKKRMQSNQNKFQYELLKQDEDIVNMFKAIISTDSGILNQKQNNFEQDTLNALTVQQQSKDHFPLCMEYLIDKLEVNHHLKHAGRQQIQLFFKSAGMKMHEAIKYMRIQFQKRISEQDFDKNYLYNIRHNYGQEGKRENYQCYTCAYNMKQNPGNDEYHGCPIKSLNSDALEKYLKFKSYTETDIKKVIDLKKLNHFQLACTEIWHMKNKNSQNNIIIDNPAIFYRESLNHHKKIQLKIETEEPTTN